MTALEKEKQEQSSRTPNGVIYDSNYSTGQRRVKENFDKNESRASPICP